MQTNFRRVPTHSTHFEANIVSTMSHVKSSILGPWLWYPNIAIDSKWCIKACCATTHLLCVCVRTKLELHACYRSCPMVMPNAPILAKSINRILRDSRLWACIIDAPMRVPFKKCLIDTWAKLVCRMHMNATDRAHVCASHGYNRCLQHDCHAIHDPHASWRWIRGHSPGIYSWPPTNKIWEKCPTIPSP